MSSLGITRNDVDRRASIAIDLGAESCRVSLLRWKSGEAELRCVHRVANGPVQAMDGTLRWPWQRIVQGVEEGIARCAELAPEGIASLAVDGWAVDYVRLDTHGEVLEEPYCYRDARTVTAMMELHTRISPERMRSLTGIELQTLNTVYQLYADKISGKGAAQWLNLPEYLLYRWGGDAVAEYTNASHTQMLDAHHGAWSPEIFEAAGLEISIAPRLVPAGTIVGKLSGSLASAPALRDCVVIAPACHDTASAIAGIAETGDDWAYLSCGTWSLLGTLTPAPVDSPEVRKDNFTNLRGVGGVTCFHKGVNGLWVLKQCMEFWNDAGQPWEIEALLLAADREVPPPALLDVDDPALAGVGGMPSRINALLSAKESAPLSEASQDAPRMVCLLLHSLAARYAQVIDRVRVHTRKEMRRIVMVGGGAQNGMLRRLTAEKTGLEVVAGPVESSTIGNLAVQRAVLAGARPSNPGTFAKEVTLWAKQIGQSTSA